MGLVFKYVAFAGASQLLVVGFCTLALVYFLGAFYPAVSSAVTAPYPGYVPPTAEKSVLAEVVVPRVQGQALAVTLIGILFKLQFLPGASTMLLIGTISLALVAAIQLYHNNLSRKALAIALGGASMLYISADSLVRQFYRHDPVFVEKMLYHLHHPADKEAAEEVQRLRQARQR